jgi:DNA-binding NtrC family response regulator
MRSLKGTILVVEDDVLQRGIVKTILAKDGFYVEDVGTGREALELVKNTSFDLVLTDLRLPDVEGTEILKEVRSQMRPCHVIIMTAYGSIQSAIEATKLGAFQYLEKPFEKDQLLLVIKNAMAQVVLLRDNLMLKDQLFDKFHLDNIIGDHGSMHALFATVRKVAPTNSTVLIYGESGTGKELFAKSIHYNSPRKNHPFFAINCAAIPENLLESELFGYEKGAFTGAVAQKTGRFEQAEEGSLFLDEIGNLPMSVQVKLLRVLQERHFHRLGGKLEHRFGATVITATNVDLEKAIREGRFREDLYYRLNEFVLRLPPLRERRSDITLLVKHFLDVFNRQFGKAVDGAAPEVMSLFMNYAWPGNVRELKNVIKRGVVLAEGRIETAHLPEGTFITRDTLSLAAPYLEALPPPPEGLALKEIVKRETASIEKRVIVQTLEATRWNRSLTAKKLAIDYKTLYNKMKEYGIG